jgi:hypothetical protein
LKLNIRGYKNIKPVIKKNGKSAEAKTRSASDDTPTRSQAPEDQNKPRKEPEDPTPRPFVKNCQ